MANKKQEVRKLMQSLLEKKTADLNKIDTASAEVRSRLSDLRQAMSEATTALDPDAYGSACAEAGRLENTLKMYKERRGQIEKSGYIPETESDAVIDSLVDYQRRSNEDFRTQIAEPLASLQKIISDYKDQYRDSVALVGEWTGTICANYRTPYMTQKDGSHRSESPAPVVGILGFFPQMCEEVVLIESLCKKIEAMSTSRARSEGSEE